MYVIMHKDDDTKHIIGTCITQSRAKKACRKLNARYEGMFVYTKTASINSWFFEKWLNKTLDKREQKRYNKLKAKYQRLGDELLKYED